jgi:hypothetical protein
MLKSVRRRLDQVNASLEVVDYSMRHYLAQIEQITSVSTTTAGVEIVWHDIEKLQSAYTRRMSAGSDGHGHGNAGLNGRIYDSPTSEAHLYRSSANAPRHPSPSPITALQPRPPPKRKSTRISPTLPSLYQINMTPWPRRMALDPTGTRRVDPISRAELVLEEARKRTGGMDAMRKEARERLQGMIGEVDGLIRQKDHVRSWTKGVLETVSKEDMQIAKRTDRTTPQIRGLHATVDQLKRQARGDSSARMGRMKDSITDGILRGFLSPLFKFWYGAVAYLLTIVGLRSVRREGAGGSSGWRAVAWVGVKTAVVVGVIAYFWYLGG